MGKLVFVLAATLAACSHQAQEIETMSTQTVARSTPVLVAERIEPSLAFWEKLGFERSSEVPAGDHLGFAILTNGKVELMYQSLDSIADDMPQIRDTVAGSKTLLFVEVPSLATVRNALRGAAVYMQERKTFYGATEIGYREPAGHLVTFAEFGKK